MSENEKFEQLAARFKKETGVWPPGKSMPKDMQPQPGCAIRAEFFVYWCANRWIPVEERLPEKLNDIFIFTDSGVLGFYDTIIKRFYFWAGKWVETTKVTHWMEIPTLPEKEKK